jgi:ABC-type transport system involved in multi-copper enzyme maturation permease subunit
MFKELLIKELADKITDKRFLWCTILCTLTLLITESVLLNDYKTERNDYNLRLLTQKEFIDKYAHENRLGDMVDIQRPPAKLSLFAKGISNDIDVNTFTNNSFNVLFPPIDFAFIIAAIYSLIAILFSHYSFSGESENGTLRLILSNPVSRTILTMAKFLGGMLNILFSLIISLVVGIIYILLDNNITLVSTDLMELGLVFLLSVFYISIFYLTGMICSAITKSSSSSVLLGLFIWAVFTLVIPNLSPWVASQLFGVSSINKVEKELKIIGGIERDDLGRKLSKEIYEKHSNLMNIINAAKDNKFLLAELENNADLKSEYLALQKEVTNAWDQANATQNAKREKLSSDYFSRVDRQIALTKAISCISPFAIYNYAVTDMVGSGLHAETYFKVAKKNFEVTLQQFVEARVSKIKKTDIMYDNNKYLDIKDRPEFSFREEGITGRFSATLSNWILLLVFNILLYVALVWQFNNMKI